MNGDGGADLVEQVPALDWRARVVAARAEGWDGFDWLGCVDDIGRAERFTVVLRLIALGRPGAGLRLSTSVPRETPELDSIAAIFAGAGWHEREGTDLFGVTFVGGDDRPLLLEHHAAAPPLRKDVVLGARAATGWPGAKDPSDRGQPARAGAPTGAPPTSAAGPVPSAGSPSRRRMLPPGVPDPEVWGDRSADEPASAEEIAGSVAGGRVRRRPR